MSVPVGTRVRWLAGPCAVAAAGVGAATVLYLRDPHRPGAYGFCPFHALTGLWCPGCGGLRAANDLTHGDLAASLSGNLFVAPLVVVLLLAWGRWTWRRWHGARGRMIVLTSAASVTVVAALVVFTVLRNLPVGSALAPG